MGELAAGDRVAGYTIEGVLGRGGMGVVYRAADERLGRSVAVKVIAPEQARDPAFRRRFIEESRAAAAIDHPNVLPVYEAGEEDGVLYMASRLVDGEDLAEVLRESGPLEPEPAVAITAQVAAALDAAHARGLVHRDVKPANVLVAGAAGRRGVEHCYLTDFGLAKQDDGRTGLTATGQFVGTLDYIAPEQVQGHQLDGRADGYALGAMLFQLLTGSPPFRRDSPPALLWAHMNDPPPKVTDHRPELPTALDAVIARTLAKRPAERFATCGELAEAAAAALEDGEPPAPARPPVPETVAAGTRERAAPQPGTPRPQPAAPARRRVLPFALLALVLIGVVGVAGALLLGGGGEEDGLTRLGPGDAEWSARAGGPIVSTPAVAGGTLVGGADDRRVRAFDAASGRERWTARTEGPVRSSPLLDGGAVYVGSFDGNLYALEERDGEERWTAPTGFEVFSSPAISDGTLVVGADGVLALDAESGAERWRADAGGAVNSSPAIDDGVAYVGAADGALLALAARNGRERWRAQLAGGAINSSPGVAGGAAFVGAPDGLHAVETASGEERWALESAGGINSSPTVEDGTVFVGTRAGTLLAVDAESGEEVWSFRAGDAVDSSPAVSDGVVYAGANDGVVHGVDAESGEERWRFDAGSPVVASPVVAGGLVYVATDGGDIFAVPASEV